MLLCNPLEAGAGRAGEGAMKCPIKFPNDAELQSAFEEMFRRECNLSDWDYLTESPALETALEAARRFNYLLDKKRI